jgi:hypothetical protein
MSAALTDKKENRRAIAPEHSEGVVPREIIEARVTAEAPQWKWKLEKADRQKRVDGQVEAFYPQA